MILINHFLALLCSNLLVIQHLETLYLGENHIRVVCERVWRKVQECATQQGLATGSRLVSRQRRHTCEACEEAKESRQLLHYRTKLPASQAVSSQLRLATQSSSEAKSPYHSICKKLTFRIPNTHQYKYPLYPRIVESFQREFWERNPREKQDWFIHNLYTLILQIPLLSPSPLLHPWKVHLAKSFSHHTHIYEKAIWCLGSS